MRIYDDRDFGLTIRAMDRVIRDGYERKRESEFIASIDFNFYDTEQDSPREYLAMPETERRVLDAWVRLMFHRTNRTGEQSSNALKQHYETATRLYVSNAQFKGAMLQAGYIPGHVWKKERNWYFAVRCDYNLDSSGNVRLFGQSMRDVYAFFRLIALAHQAHEEVSE
jgi:hypothetical protein